MTVQTRQTQSRILCCPDKTVFKQSQLTCNLQKQEEVKKNVAEDEEDSDDEEEQVEEGRDKKYDEYFLEHFPDDRDLPDDYKEMVIILPHSRVDKILGKALGYPSK